MNRIASFAQILGSLRFCHKVNQGSKETNCSREEGVGGFSSRSLETIGTECLHFCCSKGDVPSHPTLPDIVVLRSQPGTNAAKNGAKNVTFCCALAIFSDSRATKLNVFRENEKERGSSSGRLNFNSRMVWARFVRRSERGQKKRNF